MEGKSEVPGTWQLEAFGGKRSTGSRPRHDFLMSRPESSFPPDTIVTPCLVIIESSRHIHIASTKRLQPDRISAGKSGVLHLSLPGRDQRLFPPHIPSPNCVPKRCGRSKYVTLHHRLPCCICHCENGRCHPPPGVSARCAVSESVTTADGTATQSPRQ